MIIICSRPAVGRRRKHEAENLGGTLAVIKNEQEQKWVFATFGHDGDKGRSLWIGLHRPYPGAAFMWVDGSKLDYVNWYSGQPDNAGGDETCVHMWADGNLSGFWNDAVENTTICAVVEVPFKFEMKALTEREKALIGNWYESGKADRPECIAGTDNKLFEIYDGRAVRLIMTKQGSLYLGNRISGEIIKDRILWSNGTWWSRQPTVNEADEKPYSHGFVTQRTQASILAGPITNPANGHEYFLLTPDTWSASEAEAEQLGGTLAIIKNAAEQEWVFSQFGNYADTNRSLWLGRARSWQNAPFASVTDDKVAYYNWDTGQPDNAGGREFYVQMLTTGKWNDNIDTANPVCGVVEVPGKSNPKTLSAREKSFIGDWYNNGDPEQPCSIAATGNLLFAVDQNRDASRIIDTPEGFLFSPKWKQHIVVLDDRILWSKGNWWSREPVKFKRLAKETTVPNGNGSGLQRDDSMK